MTLQQECHKVKSLLIIIKVLNKTMGKQDYAYVTIFNKQKIAHSRSKEINITLTI